MAELLAFYVWSSIVFVPSLEKYIRMLTMGIATEHRGTWSIGDYPLFCVWFLNPVNIIKKYTSHSESFGNTIKILWKLTISCFLPFLMTWLGARC